MAWPIKPAGGWPWRWDLERQGGADPKPIVRWEMEEFEEFVCRFGHLFSTEEP